MFRPHPETVLTLRLELGPMNKQVKVFSEVQVKYMDSVFTICLVVCCAISILRGNCKCRYSTVHSTVNILNQLLIEVSGLSSFIWCCWSILETRGTTETWRNSFSISCSKCCKLCNGVTGRRPSDRLAEHLPAVRENDVAKPVPRHFNTASFQFPI